MKICYNKLQKLMIDNQMKRQDLMRAAEITSYAATKINKNEPVSLEVLMRICQVFHCDMKTMVDRFGEDVTTLAYDMTSFRIQTEISASPTFFGWVFGFNGKVQILAPESVKEQYRQMISQADEGM